MDGTESLVIDCSITMAWYFKDEATTYTGAVQASLESNRAAVPGLWPVEVVNVLLMGERRKRSTQAQATKWLRILSALPIAVDAKTPGAAFNEVLSLARSHGLTAYDAAYLELAIRLGLPLATLDNALKRAAQNVGVQHYAPPKLVADANVPPDRPIAGARALPIRFEPFRAELVLLMEVSFAGSQGRLLAGGMPRMIELRVRGGRDDRRGAGSGRVMTSEQSIGSSGWPGACRGGKSGLHRAQWWVTPTVRVHEGASGRDSATENRPPRADRFAVCLR